MLQLLENLYPSFYTNDSRRRKLHITGARQPNIRSSKRVTRRTRYTAFLPLSHLSCIEIEGYFTKNIIITVNYNSPKKAFVPLRGTSNFSNMQGFLPHRSCLSNLLFQKEFVTRLLNAGCTIYLVDPGFVKAYGFVNHRFLLT